MNVVILIAAQKGEIQFHKNNLYCIFEGLFDFLGILVLDLMPETVKIWTMKRIKSLHFF